VVEKLYPTERRILNAVANLDGENPTGEEIAAQIKSPYESHLRKLLSSLRKRGYLGGGQGEAGYPLTPKGLAAIQPPQATI
jgi:DNA-binding IscR family transcriptional regulator